MGRLGVTPNLISLLGLAGNIGAIIDRKQPLFCEWAEVVIVRGDAAPCPQTLTLTRADFARGGSAELYRTESGWKIVWAQDLRGQRPWTISGSDG